MNNIKKMDLNLLLTLDALLAEQNVTKAAQKLNLSQPSVSVQLAKLRDIFHDPLLLPGPRGMQPTAKANALREPLRQALNALEHVVAPEVPFDPLLAKNTWRIAGSDYTGTAILQPCIHALRLQAPQTRLAILEMVPSRIKKQLEQDDVDLAFHTNEGVLTELRHRVLFKEHYVLVGRVGHPALKKRLTLSQFCTLEYAMVSPDGGGFLGVADQVLAEKGIKRRVVLSVPHFLVLLSILNSTDLVALLPSRLVRNHDLLQVLTPPVEVPGFDVTMYWHERSHRDQAHQWLRKCIASSL